MILYELNLSVLVATTPTWNPPLTPYWYRAKDHELVPEPSLLLYSFLYTFALWIFALACRQIERCKWRSGNKRKLLRSVCLPTLIRGSLSFAKDITERAVLDEVARFCSRSTSDLAEAGRKPALSTNILCACSVSFGTALIWTQVFSLWKEFTSTWKLAYLEFRSNLCSVFLDFHSFTEKPVFECTFTHPVMLFWSYLVKNSMDRVSVICILAMKWYLQQLCPFKVCSLKSTCNQILAFIWYPKKIRADWWKIRWKSIYILMIKVNKLFPFFFSRCVF